MCNALGLDCLGRHRCGVQRSDSRPLDDSSARRCRSLLSRANLPPRLQYPQRLPRSPDPGTCRKRIRHYARTFGDVRSCRIFGDRVGTTHEQEEPPTVRFAGDNLSSESQGNVVGNSTSTGGSLTLRSGLGDLKRPPGYPASSSPGPGGDGEGTAATLAQGEPCRMSHAFATNAEDFGPSPIALTAETCNTLPAE